jgi:hypothetical protein
MEDEPYVLFVNQPEYGNARYRYAGLRLPAALRFRQDVKRHADAIGPGDDVVLVFMEALGLDPPLTLVCSDLHLQLEGYPVEQGVEIEIPLLPPGGRGLPRVSAEGTWGRRTDADTVGAPLPLTARRCLPMRSCQP